MLRLLAGICLGLVGPMVLQSNAEAADCGPGTGKPVCACDDELTNPGGSSATYELTGNMYCFDCTGSDCANYHGLEVSANNLTIDGKGLYTIYGPGSTQRFEPIVPAPPVPPDGHEPTCATQTPPYDPSVLSHPTHSECTNPLSPTRDSSGISFTSGSENVIIKDLTITGFRFGVDLNGRGHVVTGVKSDDNIVPYEAGVSNAGKFAYGINVDSSCVLADPLHANFCGLTDPGTGEKTKAHRIENSEFRGNGDEGVHFHSDTGFHELVGCTITDSMRENIYVQSSHHNVIKDNVVSTSTANTIDRWSWTDQELVDFDFANNLTNTRQKAMGRQRALLLEDDSNNNEIHGNVFKDRAVTFEGTAHDNKMGTNTGFNSGDRNVLHGSQLCFRSNAYGNVVYHPAFVDRTLGFSPGSGDECILFDAVKPSVPASATHNRVVGPAFAGCKSNPIREDTPASDGPQGVVEYCDHLEAPGVTPPNELDTFASISCSASNAAISGLKFTGIDPCRVVNTRVDEDGFPLDRVGPAGTGARLFSVLEECGIPNDAVAISITLSVFDATGLEPGFVTLYPGDQAPEPTVSSINTDDSFGPNEVKNNNAILRLSSDGGQTFAGLFASTTAGATADLVVDVTGYFRQP